MGEYKININSIEQITHDVKRLVCDKPDYFHGRINKKYLEQNIDDLKRKFHVCGPQSFVQDINNSLLDLGAESAGIVIEE